MLSFLLLAAALLLSVPSSASRIAGKDSRIKASSLVILGAVFCGSLVFFSVGRMSIAVAAAIIAWCVSWYIKDIMAARTRRRGREALAGYFGVVTADLRAGATLARALSRGAESLPSTTPRDIIYRYRRCARCAPTRGALRSPCGCGTYPAGTPA